jgi:hypothetical protein
MGQLYSIANRGMSIFERPIQSLIGGLEIDLVSAPIEPGTHRLELEATVGGIEIYLPKYVKYTIEGGSLIGGEDIYDGFPWHSRAFRKLAKLVGMRSKIPDHAVDNPTPDQPITLKLVIEGGIGGLEIYRL